jgi:DNA polymerase-3 subunit delta'
MKYHSSNQLNLFGHDSLFLELVELYTNGNFPNKILLSGEKGIGKCTLAYHITNFILSLDEEFKYETNNLKINPDNKSFKLIQNKSNPNFILIDVIEDKKSIDINQIRNLILNLNKSSFNSKPKIILIDNIELLNLNSVNALLKVLEEPNQNVHFILINNNKNILSTLRSRCLNFKVQLSAKLSIEITNKILQTDCSNFLNDELINNYSTPGELLKMIDFANRNNIDLVKNNLNDFIKNIILDKLYKKDTFIKDFLYSLIEIYFRNNITIENIKLITLHKYFLQKMHNTRIYNLDEESLFMEFEDSVLNG